MKATTFKETNQALGAGGNPNTQQLPVAISKDPNTDGVLFCVSKWQMTEGELEKFNETGAVWVSIMTSLKRPTQPPVMITAWNPFEDLKFRPLEYDEVQQIAIDGAETVSDIGQISISSEEGQLLITALSMIGALHLEARGQVLDPNEVIRGLQAVRKQIFS